MMTDQEIKDVFQEMGAILQGHFQLTSGRHSDTYIQCARVLENPDVTSKLAQESIERLPQDLIDSIDLVASPAVGGMRFGFAVAQALHKNFVFSERVEGKMQFRRSFTIESGQRVLVVEDVVTTGGSVKEVCDLVEAAGGEVVAVVSLIDRKTDKKFSAPFYPLLELPTLSWDPDECELCKKGIEIHSLGSRNLKK
ncbi:MAG: orotate phosphoribosyltransferase [Coriobacteriia bacterium]|nr:orotate phosphoribosyltransferase [Coriobacteriia bacterium]